MSAIVGIYCLDGQPVDRADLGRMVETLAHRGPDGEGAWRRGPVGLGHRLLWTTPESLREKFPLVNRRGDLVITADARIDNRAELISALGLAGCAAETITDGQLILAAYERWGERCPEKLVGDFAFALWDGRSRQLFCARDPMGVKPFYYYHRPGRRFIFASELKALLCLPEVPRRLNETRVADHLISIYEDGAITFYQDVLRLPAAHTLTINVGKMQLRPYWSLDTGYEVRLASDEAYAEAFLEIFTQAVSCRLRSAFPIGSALSGGLDSSSIACLAGQLLAEAGGGALHTYSAIFPGLPKIDLAKIDERQYVEAVLATGPFEPHFIRADRLSPLADLDRVLWHEDEAVGAPNLYLHWALYRAAAQSGARIFLDGLDGDSTVSHGLERLAELARSGRWRILHQEATALAARANGTASSRRSIWRYGFRPLFPEPMVQLWRRARGRDIRPIWATNSVINPHFAQRIGLADRAQALLKESSKPGNARERHWLGLRSGLYPTALELADRAAAAFSLEARYPFFDRRLIEFCVALPLSQKLKQGWTRYILRRAMSDILPPAVQWRFDKANLSPNFKRRLLDCERDILEDVILKDARLIADYVDLSGLRTVYQRYSAQPGQKNDEALIVYSAITLALWLRRTGITP